MQLDLSRNKCNDVTVVFSLWAVFLICKMNMQCTNFMHVSEKSMFFTFENKQFLTQEFNMFDGYLVHLMSVFCV